MSRNLVIVGGGAGGASVAAEARRRDPALEITMIEQGPHVSTAACPMPYYIQDLIKDERKLIARTPEKFRESGVNVRLEMRVEEVDRRQGVVRLQDGIMVPYDILVLGTGTVPIVPKVPGVDLEGVFMLKTLPDAVAIKTYIREKECRKALVVGAGFIGLEMCEALRGHGIETEMIDLAPRTAAMWDPELTAMIEEELTRKGVRFRPNTGLQSIEKGGDYALRLQSDSGPLEADFILIAIGVKPDSALAAAAGLRLGESGAIGVNFSQRTSEEGIYAVGDCAEVYHRISRKWTHIPLGDIANKQGRVAGINIGGGEMVFPGVVGARCFKIFDLEVAATGLDEDEAAEAGYHPESVLIWGSAIVAAMPGEKKLGLKLVADRPTGKLLGAQAVGARGAVERVNALSVALAAGMTLADIGYQDFAYSPPFNTSWDLIHIAAQKLAKSIGD
ncbi:MAG: FAD-dependent oxidoreductase [Acidobacteria bacterium]|nr:FAD-dependent oxidoreductase [Acidobacteriota bacterium]